MAVRVVNAYEAASLFVLVILDRNVDFPTDGKPTNATRASPLLLTSNPWPPPPPAPPAGSSSWALNRASFLDTRSVSSQFSYFRNVSAISPAHMPFEETKMIFCNWPRKPVRLDVSFMGSQWKKSSHLLPYSLCGISASGSTISIIARAIPSYSASSAFHLRFC